VQHEQAAAPLLDRGKVGDGLLQLVADVIGVELGSRLVPGRDRMSGIRPAMSRPGVMVLRITAAR